MAYSQVYSTVWGLPDTARWRYIDKVKLLVMHQQVSHEIPGTERTDDSASSQNGIDDMLNDVSVILCIQWRAPQPTINTYSYKVMVKCAFTTASPVTVTLTSTIHLQPAIRNYSTVTCWMFSKSAAVTDSRHKRCLKFDAKSNRDISKQNFCRIHLNLVQRLAVQLRLK